MDNSTLQRLQVEAGCRDYFKQLDERRDNETKHRELKEKQALNFMLNSHCYQYGNI